jgi:integrase
MAGFTGLAYIDAKKLKRSEIVIGIDGERWIYTRRKKTDAPTRIPLLPVVLEIMEAYKDHPQCVIQDCLLPVPSNCKLNAYLKEVADLCGIPNISPSTLPGTLLLLLLPSIMGFLSKQLVRCLGIKA